MSLKCDLTLDYSLKIQNRAAERIFKWGGGGGGGGGANANA